MDDDIIPMHNSTCFICDGPDLPAQRLIKANTNSYSTFLKHAEGIKKDAVLDRLKKGLKEENLMYHINC